MGRDPEGAEFGAIDERRKLALAVFDWCAVCGMPFGDEPRWQVLPLVGEEVNSHAEMGFGEAPVHEVCAVYAAQVCPHLSSPNARLGDGQRAGQRREQTVELGGFRRTTQVNVHPSPIQQGKSTLTFCHADEVNRFAYSRPEELEARYHQLLCDEQDIFVKPSEAKLIALFNSMVDENNEDPGGVVAGAAMYAGAVFAPSILSVLGLSAYASHANSAHLFLDHENLRIWAIEAKDPATKLMARWLIARKDNIPDVLAEWRKIGRTSPPPTESRSRRAR
ncbi:hypothetical protein KGQ20_07275 [Catenulispora sp. NF23]|uniref:hypothetical protein n=1 Tax=Catenulispora pinistramenti TaxID=2705254 RepID=UPI001BAAF8FF|nr:hypothetical protein [Catenulispora pinistramenti]MBS2532570.1 hypothetical protein [Catenulispora pinistramenti]